MAVQGLSPAAGGGASNPSPAAKAPRKEASITTTATRTINPYLRPSNFVGPSSCGDQWAPQSSETYETIHLAAHLGEVAYVEAQLRIRTNPNEQSDKGLPLVHAAIESNSREMVKSILSYHPDMTATFSPTDQLPPLDPYAYAIYLGAIHAFDALMDSNQPPTVRLDPIGNWLHLALRFMQYETINHLRTTYPELFAKMISDIDNQKRTPKQLAIELGDREALVALLGEKKGRKKVLSWEAQTPLNPSIVEFNGGVGAGAMAFVGTIQVLEEQNALDNVEAFLGSSTGVIPAALAALGCSSQEMQYWISQFPLDQMLDELLDRAFKPIDFQPEEAKRTPSALVRKFNMSPPLCKGTVLKNSVNFMIECVTSQKCFTLGDLQKQASKEERKHHLMVPIRKEDGQIEMIRSDDKTYHEITLNTLILAAMATPGLFPRVHIRAIKNGKEEVCLPNCTDPSLAHCKPTSFICNDDTGLPYFKRGTLCFSLSSSTPPLDCPSSDAPLQERALYLVSIHHTVRRLHMPTQRQRTGQVIIDTRGHGISSDPTLFIHAGRTPTHKYFRSRQCTLPPLSFTPYQRPELTEEIEGRVLFTAGESFEDSRRLTILQSPPGMGKSTLAHMVISTHRKHFSDLLVIDYDTPSTTYASLRAIAESLELFVESYEDSAAIAKKIKGLLETHHPEKPWLLLCENCHEVPDELLPESGGSIICCVTREPDEPPIDNALLIPALTSDQALELLTKETQAIREMGDLDTLAKRLDHHAQALMQAALYIKEHAIPIATYLTLLGDPSKEIDPTSETIGVVLSHLTKHTPHSAGCLAVFARLAPDAIPEKWVEQWIARIDDPHRPTTYEILTQLERCGLMTYHPESQQFSIQRKTRIAIQKRTAEEKERIAELIQLMISLKTDFRLDNPSTWPFGRTWAIHAQFLIDATQEIDPLSKGMIYQTLGEIYLCTGEAQWAMETFQKAKTALTQVQNSEARRAQVLLGLGSAALERLDLDLAQESFKAGLTLAPDDCSLLCGLGDTFFAQENYKEAERVYSSVDKQYRPQPLSSRNKAYPAAKLGWAETYLEDQTEDSLILAAQILEEAEDLFQLHYQTAPHPNVARRCLLLARVYHAQKKFAEAEDHVKKALTIYKALYPRETHPQIALAYDRLAWHYLNRGQLKKALKESRRALGVMRYIFPNTYHPTTIKLLERQVNILKQLHRYREMCDALIEQSNLLDQKAEPDVMLNRTVKAKAEELYYAGSYKEAISYYKAILSVYRHYDPDLAKTFDLAGKEAFDAEEYAVSTCLREDAFAIICTEPQQPPTDFTALLLARMGLAYTHLEKYPNAHNCLEHSIEIYGTLYPYATEIANSPYSLAQKTNVSPLHKVGHLLATVQLYKESASLYEAHELTQETVNTHTLLFAPLLSALAKRCYDNQEYLSAAHHWQSLTTFLSPHEDALKDCAYAYYRLAKSQYQGGKKKAAEDSAKIAQKHWEQLISKTPINHAEEHASLLICLGKTQYLRWRYAKAAETFQQADDLLQQLIEQSDDPSKIEEWQKLRAFLAEKIRANTLSLASKWIFDYS